MIPWAKLIPWAGYAVALAMVIAWLGARDRISELETKLASQVEETQEAADANATNLVTIETLTTANKSLVDERRAFEARTMAEIEKRTQVALAAQTEADKLRRERDAIIRGDARCKARGESVLADVCPDIAERLRIRAENPGSH
jgi:chromosome segregation ATPase